MTIFSTGFYKILNELLMDNDKAKSLIALSLKRSCCSKNLGSQYNIDSKSRLLTPRIDLAFRSLNEGDLNDLRLIESIKSIEEMGRDIMELISSFADFKKQQPVSFVDDMKINFILFCETRLSFDETLEVNLEQEKKDIISLFKKSKSAFEKKFKDCLKKLNISKTEFKTYRSIEIVLSQLNDSQQINNNVQNFLWFFVSNHQSEKEFTDLLVQYGNQLCKSVDYCLSEISIYKTLENFSDSELAEWFLIRQSMKSIESLCTRYGSEHGNQDVFIFGHIIFLHMAGDVLPLACKLLDKTDSKFLDCLSYRHLISDFNSLSSDESKHALQKLIFHFCVVIEQVLSNEFNAFNTNLIISNLPPKRLRHLKFQLLKDLNNFYSDRIIKLCEEFLGSLKFDFKLDQDVLGKYNLIIGT